MNTQQKPLWHKLLLHKNIKGQLREEMLGHSIKSIIDIENIHDIKNKYIILGVPDDRGVALNCGSLGAKEGPEKFRSCFYKLYDTFLQNNCSSVNKNISSLGSYFIDAGDVKLDKSIEQTHEHIAILVEQFLHLGAEVVFVIGGGHDFSFGSYKGHTLWSKEKIIPIFNFDAHLDLRPVENKKINSGTAFWRCIQELGSYIGNGEALIELGVLRSRNPHSLFEYSKKNKITVVEYDPFLILHRNISNGHVQKIIEHIRDHFDHCAKLGFTKSTGTTHFSFCLDVLNQSIAPGTSASSPFGLDLKQLLPSLGYFAKSSSCKVVDVAELCPTRDYNDQTARLCAEFVYNFAKLRQESLSLLE